MKLSLRGAIPYTLFFLNAIRCTLNAEFERVAVKKKGVYNIWLTELAFLCIVFAAGMSHFISAKLNWQQKVLDIIVLGKFDL